MSLKVNCEMPSISSENWKLTSLIPSGISRFIVKTLDVPKKKSMFYSIIFRASFHMKERSCNQYWKAQHIGCWKMFESGFKIPNF